MKIALITDLHIGARNDNILFQNYFHRFYDNIFFPYLDDHEIKTCIMLGDIVDRRKYVNFRSLNYLRTNIAEHVMKQTVLRAEEQQGQQKQVFQTLSSVPEPADSLEK